MAATTAAGPSPQHAEGNARGDDPEHHVQVRLPEDAMPPSLGRLHCQGDRVRRQPVETAEKGIPLSSQHRKRSRKPAGGQQDNDIQLFEVCPRTCRRQQVNELPADDGHAPVIHHRFGIVSDAQLMRSGSENDRAGQGDRRLLGIFGVVRVEAAAHVGRLVGYLPRIRYDESLDGVARHRLTVEGNQKTCHTGRTRDEYQVMPHLRPGVVQAVAGFYVREVAFRQGAKVEGEGLLPDDDARPADRLGDELSPFRGDSEVGARRGGHQEEHE